jgi:fatty-acyl-CoA synthase
MERTTIGDLFDRVAHGAGDREAIVFSELGTRWSYRDALARVQLLAKGLIGLGVESGDHVAVWATNRPQWVLLQLAIAKVGGVLVTINPAATADELAHILAHSDASTLFLNDRGGDTDALGLLTACCPELPGARPARLVSKRFPRLKRVALIDDHGARGVLAWPEVLAASAGITDHLLRRRQEGVDPADLSNLQYTAGTTGLAKAAALTHVNVTTTAHYAGECMRLTARDRVCVPVPFYECLGWALGTLVTIGRGAVLIVPSDCFDAEKTLTAIADERCTALHGLPAMFRAEMAQRGFHDLNLASLRTGIVAGAPCVGDLMQQIVRRMHAREITVAYGPSEGSGAITQTRTEDPLELRATTVGRALPHVEVKIVDPATARDVPPGTTGELCCRGYPVMRGYYKDPDGTAAAIDREGWLHTGDLVAIDEHGYCRLTGRVAETVFRGGEHVRPQEVETIIHAHPKVHDVQVFGVPDAVLGEELAAWIRLREGETATVAEIRDFCRARVAHSKVPRYVRFVDRYPLTSTGKVRKFRMREIMTEELKLPAAQ